MKEKLHIIITGESGKTLRLPFERKKLLVYSVSAAVILVILTITSIYSFSLFSHNRSIARQLEKLQSQVSRSDKIMSEIQQKAEEEREKLSLEVASLQLEKENQLAAFQEEKDQLLSTAVSELTERSELIETIMDNIGIKLNRAKNPKNQNSGGPFIEHSPGIQDDLLYKTDEYLKEIQSIPLGRPVTGPITSRFGARKDPLNSKKSFHEGIDFRGRRGDKIYATGDGVVVKAFKNGSYGNYVMIDHKNGYQTSFAHMDKFLVKKGERVKRGQLIGKVGNTGRSTGPHLHYELLHNGTPVNPLKYMQIAKLLQEHKSVKVVKLDKPSKIVKSSSPVAEKL
jgi:murein DD-endopeptidase MepM/ murein hydrolase activator NlpD